MKTYRYQGHKISFEISGGSHEPFLSARVEGFPVGENIDSDMLSSFMARRAPSNNPWSTSRHEHDIVEFISGVSDDGTIETSQQYLRIKNRDTKRADYSPFFSVPRPSHADYVARVLGYNREQLYGGGPFSGRMSALYCAIGGIAIQLLSKRGIDIGAHIMTIGDNSDVPFPLQPDSKLFEDIHIKDFPVIDEKIGAKMKKQIEEVREEGDSIGGMIECCAVGVPVGIGDAQTERLEASISQLMFSVPAVRALSFGDGINACSMRGSQYNDSFIISNGRIATETNHAGGINGGISNGMPIRFTVCIKPTASISIPQHSVNIDEMTPTLLEIQGRHDACIAVRAVPVIEAMCAIALYDRLP